MTPMFNRLKNLLETYYNCDITVSDKEAELIDFELGFEYDDEDLHQVVYLTVYPGNPAGLTLELAERFEIDECGIKPLTLNPTGMPKILIYEDW